MKKSLLLTFVVTLAAMFVGMGFFSGCIDGGTVVGDTHWSVSQLLWIAPDTGGTFEVRCDVSRGEPDRQEKSVNITVIEEG